MDLEWSIEALPNGPRTGPDRQASLSLSCFLIYPNKALGDSHFIRPLFACRFCFCPDEIRLAFANRDLGKIIIRRREYARRPRDAYVKIYGIIREIQEAAFSPARAWLAPAPRIFRTYCGNGDVGPFASDT